jgi:uncharacterized RDD family membrane protein YckC
VAKLIINPTSSSRREVSLARTLLSIGRDPSNDLVLPDALVSRRHAVIECRGEQYVIRDCNSSNGSLVNGDRVTEHALKDGDLLAIGTARLLFRETVEVEDPAAKVVQHPSAPRLSCPSCKADYRKGDLFCRHCGQALPAPAPSDVACPQCGKSMPLPARFCSGCGTALSVAAPERVPAAVPPAGQAAPAPAPVAEAGPSPVAAPARNEALEPTRPRPLPIAAPADPPALPGGAQPAPDAPPDVEMRSVPTPMVAGAGALQAPPVVAARPLPVPAPVRALRPTALPAPPVGLRSPSSSLPAGFGPRLAAFLVDGVLVTAAQAVLVAPAAFAFYRWYEEAQQAGREPDFLPVLLSVALVTSAVILGCGYYVYFWGVTGATPGKRAMGLVIEGADGRRPIGIGRAFLRLLGYALSGAVLGIGFLMIAIGGQGLHDRLASTRVVSARGRS